jgi:hypothetical protein
MRETGAGHFCGHRSFLALPTGDSLSGRVREKVLLNLATVPAAFPGVTVASRAPEVVVARDCRDLPGRLPAL